jgi:hypothetical protein
VPSNPPIKCVCGCSRVEVYKFVSGVFNSSNKDDYYYVPNMQHSQFVAICANCRFVGPMAFSPENAVTMFVNQISQMETIKESKKTGESPQQGES